MLRPAPPKGPTHSKYVWNTASPDDTVVISKGTGNTPSEGQNRDTTKRDVPVTYAKHEREKGGDDGAVDVVLLRRAQWREAVELVEEDNRRRALGRLLEEQPQLTRAQRDRGRSN